MSLDAIQKLLIEMFMAVIFALCLYYGVALPLMGDTRWAAALSAGLGGFIAVRIGKKLT